MGVEQAARAGYGSVVVACEPTGHRWQVLDQITAGQGVPLVCVQPLLVARAREAEDFTRNKNDDADAMVIARLVTELRCYLPERAEPGWTRLRHLGARRARFVVQAAAAHQQIRDLLECAWPAVLGAAAHPLDSRSWLAAVTVACDLAVAAGGQLGGPNSGNGGGNGGGNGWGWEAFAAAVRAELGPTRWHSPIVGAVFDAATDPAHTGVGVLEQRLGALERVRFTITDLAHLEHEIAVVEAA